MSGYRTFSDGVDEWRWDGVEMDIFNGLQWVESMFTSPGELIRDMNVSETTPPSERDPSDQARESREHRMIEEEDAQ